jgi:hypothetical protein
MFAETPVVKGKKGAPAKKPAEPVKPAARLCPARLVKTGCRWPSPRRKPKRSAAARRPPAPEVSPSSRAAGSRSACRGARQPATVSLGQIEEQPEPVAAAPPRPAEPIAHPPTAGRIIPPTLRLRIEEQRPTTPTPPLPTAPPRSMPRPAPRIERPTGTAATRAASGGVAGQTSTPSARPPAQPMPPRPAAHPSRMPGSTARPLPGPATAAFAAGGTQLPGLAAGNVSAAAGVPGRPPMRPSYQPAPASGPRRGWRARQHRLRPPPVTRTITLAEGMTVKDLAVRSTCASGICSSCSTSGS